MPQSEVGSIQGSNKDFLPMKGHTRGGGTHPQCNPTNRHTNFFWQTDETDWLRDKAIYWGSMLPKIPQCLLPLKEPLGFFSLCQMLSFDYKSNFNDFVFSAEWQNLIAPFIGRAFLGEKTKAKRVFFTTFFLTLKENLGVVKIIMNNAKIYQISTNILCFSHLVNLEKEEKSVQNVIKIWEDSLSLEVGRAPIISV